MNVCDLQQFLRSLSQPLSVSGAKKAADELDRACAGLEPFRDLSLAQFAEFLGRAEQYARTGIVPTTGRPKTAAKGGAPAGDPQALATAIEHVRAFYDRVVDPEVTYGTIEVEVKQLDKKFKKDELIEIAKAMGIYSTLRTKQAARDEIKRCLTERKESFQRTQF
jgi:hypothetical protein